MDVAVKLDHAWTLFDPFVPVPADDADGWYEDLTEARGAVSNIVRQIARQIRRATRPPRLLLLGHPGSGKSTELARLRRELQGAGWRCVLVETDRDLHREDLALPELYVLLVQRVGEALAEVKLELPVETVRRVDAWFVEEIRLRERKVEASAGAGAGSLMQRVFGGALADLVAEVRVSESRRVELREKVRARLRDFVDLVAEVVGKATEVLQLHDLRGLVLLVDGLEKANLGPEGGRRVAELLFEQSESWARLAVPLVLTAPLELLSESTRIANHFDEFHLIPAIPVRGRPDRGEDSTGTYVLAGRAALRRLIERRVPTAQLFADPHCVELLIDRSGGSIRDLFRLIRGSIDHTEEDGPISREAVDRAWRHHTLQVEVMLQPQDIEQLRMVEQQPGELLYDAAGVRLLRREMALPYVNGGRWFGVHPALRPRLSGGR